jgi:hypothetical protein
MPWTELRIKPIFPRAGIPFSGIKKLGSFRRDKSALSSLITVTGIMAIIVMLLSAIMNTLIPQWAKEDESRHMEEVLDNYISIRVNVNNLIEKSDFDISIAPLVKLGASGNIPAGVVPSFGKLILTPFDNMTQEQIHNLNDSLSIYGKGGGNLEYEAENFYFQDQNIVYEHGAVVLAQSSGASMRAGPGFTATKSMLLNDSRTYGFFDPGTKENPDKVRYSFGGRRGNLTLSYDIYDIDTSAEVLIKLNGEVLRRAPMTGDKKWTGPHTLDLPGNVINDFTMNLLEFNHTIRVGEEWGIRNVSIDANHTSIVHTMISLIGNKEDVGGRDSHTINTKLLARELNSYEWPGENLTINFSTKYPEAWEDYFDIKLNESSANLYWSADRTQSDYYITRRKTADDYYMVSVVIKEVNSLECTLAIVTMKLS